MSKACRIAATANTPIEAPLGKNALRVSSTPWPCAPSRLPRGTRHIPEHDAGGKAALEPGQVVVLLDLGLAREMGALGDDERDPAGCTAHDSHDVRPIAVPATQVR